MKKTGKMHTKQSKMHIIPMGQDAHSKNNGRIRWRKNKNHNWITCQFYIRPHSWILTINTKGREWRNKYCIAQSPIILFNQTIMKIIFCTTNKGKLYKRYIRIYKLTFRLALYIKLHLMTTYLLLFLNIVCWLLVFPETHRRDILAYPAAGLQLDCLTLQHLLGILILSGFWK
jgi:hypothetical protein